MKKFFCYALLIISTCIFTACPSDNDEEDVNNHSKDVFIGLWNYGKSDANLMFFNDGITVIKHEYKNNYFIGSWTYNENTCLLATTLAPDAKSMQWEITISTEDEWGGICLHEPDKVTGVAKRNVKNEDLAYFLTNITKWRSESGDILFISNKSQRVHVDKCSEPYNPGGQYYIKDITYDEVNDKIRILYYDNDYIDLIHPYSFNCTLYIYFRHREKGVYYKQFSRYDY